MGQTTALALIWQTITTAPWEVPAIVAPPIRLPPFSDPAKARDPSGIAASISAALTSDNQAIAVYARDPARYARCLDAPDPSLCA